MRLSRRSEAFDSDQFIFELKIDGFRALAHIQDGKGELVSRNGKVFSGFADLAASIAEHVRIESAVVDGEIACIDEAGRPVFRDLLFRRRECVFIAFDLLYLNGKELRVLPLLERKAMLKNFSGGNALESSTSTMWKRTGGSYLKKLLKWRVSSASARIRRTT